MYLHCECKSNGHLAEQGGFLTNRTYQRKHKKLHSCSIIRISSEIVKCNIMNTLGHLNAFYANNHTATRSRCLCLVRGHWRSDIHLIQRFKHRGHCIPFCFFVCFHKCMQWTYKTKNALVVKYHYKMRGATKTFGLF